MPINILALRNEIISKNNSLKYIKLIKYSYAQNIKSVLKKKSKIDSCSGWIIWFEIKITKKK